MGASADGPVATGGTVPLETRVSRQELAAAAASRPGRTKRDHKRKAQAPPGATDAAADLIRVEAVPKNHPALYTFSRVEVCKYDRAPEVQLSEDRLGAIFRLGFRMARATHGVYQGTWYFEVTITHLGATGHCRLGWSTCLGECQAPVGYSVHSFGYRDLTGSKVHKAVPEEYGEPFREGDVIGCLIHLPPGGRPFEYSKQDIVSYRSGLYFLPTGNAAPGPLAGSFVAFFRNGKAQGTAYRDIPEGTYHPALSMYTLPEQAEGATATFNFGPDFKHPPPMEEGVPPASAICLLAKEQSAPDTLPLPEAAQAQPPAQLQDEAKSGPPAQQQQQQQQQNGQAAAAPVSKTGVPAALAAITRPLSALMNKNKKTSSNSSMRTASQVSQETKR